MFRLCSENLTVVDWISLLITEQVFITTGYMRFVLILKIRSDTGRQSALYSRYRESPDEQIMVRTNV
jgi:hypothetical protein